MKEGLLKMEVMLRAACSRVEADGYDFVRGVTIDKKAKACCALGALAIVIGKSDSNWPFEDAANKLGITMGAAKCIAAGFDSRPQPDAVPNFQEYAAQLYYLGACLALRFRPYKQGDLPCRSVVKAAQK